MTLLDFLILSLATWRLSSLLANEDGPRQIFAGLRFRAVTFTGLLECVWCVSIWIGAALAIAYYFYPVITFWIALPFALSTVAIMVDKWTQ